MTERTIKFTMRSGNKIIAKSSVSIELIRTALDSNKASFFTLIISIIAFRYQWQILR